MMLKVPGTRSEGEEMEKLVLEAKLNSIFSPFLLKFVWQVYSDSPLHKIKFIADQFSVEWNFFYCHPLIFLIWMQSF